MTQREEMFDILAKAGFERTHQCCAGVPLKVCSSDEWRGNMDSLFFHIEQAAKAQAVPQWIPVSERLPEERDNPYQVAATCVKEYKGAQYDGMNKRTIVQDWVVRRWPNDFIAWFELPWFELPATPVKDGGE